ncbi:MAG: hypothetical protein IT371_28215 [Deltaproteobacteria bacterium]|nr:hypothetical protein [Deltaproteobacteria bacterium]
MNPVALLDEIPLLDERGCLTPEAMGFAEEMGPEQQAVVARHVRSCPDCAQQQASLARVAHRVRRGRPRVLVPPEARIAARQAAIRGLVRRRKRTGSIRRRSPVEVIPQAPRAWYVARPALTAALLGAAAAIMLSLALVLLFKR